jgi:hypothetical protein
MKESERVFGIAVHPFHWSGIVQGRKGQNVLCPSAVLALHSPMWDEMFQQLVQVNLLLIEVPSSS